jgi:quercetin dioxygenase-like cupin family protein
MIRAGDSVFFEPGERHWHGGNKLFYLAPSYTEALTRG